MSEGPSRDLTLIEGLIGRIFRAGIVVTALLLVAGLALSLAHSVLAPRVLSAGIVVLLLIPAARVLVSCVDALRRRDALLTAATVMVILALIALLVR